MPLTAITTFIGSLSLLGSWLLIGARIRKAKSPLTKQVILLHRFFLCMGLFFLIMFIPHLWLSIDATRFPIFMIAGYTIGHIFLYIALTYTGRLLFSMIPSLAAKENWMTIFGYLATIAITIATILTLPFADPPVYDYQNNVTILTTSPIVSTSITVFSLLTALPAAVLMFINGIRNHRARIRSFLLGGGLFILMGGGPIHDIARSSTVFMFADAVTIFGLALIAIGILYRFEERLTPESTN